MDHLDQQALATLKDVMEDDFSLLVNTFLQDSENRLKTLNSLIDSDNQDAIRRAAHSFKGSCGNVGAPILASLCAELEKKAVANDIDNIKHNIDLIKTEYEIVKSLLLGL
jgi:HPt (histidine-containing phosphotransfer) domain-containing protein